ncbi:MAG: GIY-YIG nuclease family protein [Methanoregulaceae archaeon]|nr:GIY-YIG nuclease family protein [Methanoregulaceae archaeon]
MDKGVYCLRFSCSGTRIRPGALGEIVVKPGWLVYTGSAQGPGGLSRVRRHIAFAEKQDRIPRWHVDYLLGSPEVCLRSAVCAITAKNLECTLASALPGNRIPGFGSSDCRCGSHLAISGSDPAEAITGAFTRIGLVPIITTIKREQHEE